MQSYLQLIKKQLIDQLTMCPFHFQLLLSGALIVQFYLACCVQQTRHWPKPIPILE